MKKYKVVIIGAGPAGLCTAVNLNKRGIKDIVVVDKCSFPRYKCCAGYITKKTKEAFENIGIDIDKCHYTLIDNFKILYKYKEKQRIKNKYLFTNRNIDRVELDYAFYNLAKSKNIKIIENCNIKKNDIDEKSIVLSNGEKISYEYLVFADGTYGYGSTYQKNKKQNLAMQKIFNSDREDGIEIHFGITKRGYGWVSTYDGITNVGLTDLFDKNINYNMVFTKFLKQLNLPTGVADLKGAFTPYGIKKPIINNYIYFVGDAVGACDPLTLSGLRYGLKSGELCAKSICLKNNKIYIKYIKRLKIRFNLVKVLMKVFYLKTTLFLVFNIGCRIFSKLISIVFNNFFVSKK